MKYNQEMDSLDSADPSLTLARKIFSVITTEWKGIFMVFPSSPKNIIIDSEDIMKVIQTAIKKSRR